MDIEHIRRMVKEEQIRISHKFQQRMLDRDFNFKQAEKVILNGRVVEEQIKKGKPTKYLIKNLIEREGILDELCIEIAVTDVVIFISGYWPKDKQGRRR